MDEVSVHRAGPEAIDRLEPLWGAMMDHHRTCEPRASHVRPFRANAESWRRRRARYEEWLAKEDSALLLAERGDRVVGYAVVTVGGGEASLETGERTGNLESLSVLPGERGRGTGAALMAATHDHLRALGVREYGLFVMDGNAGAVRFYERFGLRPYVQMLFGEVPG